MFSTLSESAASPYDPLATGLAVSALVISLLAVVVPAATGKQQRLRDDRAKRSEMYLEVMEIVEGHGQWVVDRTYDLLETSHEDFVTEMPHRRTAKPDRALRVRARAIVSAYGSTEVSDAFSHWKSSLEQFEQKLDVFAFIAQEEGEHAIDATQLEPLRDSEIAARMRLADVMNAQLIQERRWRRLQATAN